MNVLGRKWPNPMLLTVIIAIVVLAVFITPPLQQDAVYHAFADTRQIWGIPHFWNVVTSVPFLVTGIAGLAVCLPRLPSGGIPALHTVYLTFFAGVLLVGAGSTYYHLAPSMATLVWDRLPMTIAFMAFVSIIIGERISPGCGRLLLVPLLLAGAASVLYWHFTELQGVGDLRPYILVQFLPLLLISAILFMYGPRLTGDYFIWLTLFTYILAKLTEYFDAELFRLLGALSGHSLKHLLACLAAVWMIIALKKRRAAGII